MSRRKGEDTPARKRRRLPHVADLGRADPFRREDWRQLEEQCSRITNGQEFHIRQRVQRDQWMYVVHFSEAHQAKALADWVRRQRFSERPAPTFGPSPDERTAFEQAAVAWGVRTGAIRRAVQAWRRKAHEGGSLLQCQTAAQMALRPYLPPDHGHFDMAQVFVSWVQREHGQWFYGRRSSRCSGSRRKMPTRTARPTSKTDGRTGGTVSV